MNSNSVHLRAIERDRVEEQGTSVVVRLYPDGHGGQKIVAVAMRPVPRNAADIEQMVRAFTVVLRQKLYPYMDPSRTMPLVAERGREE